MTFFDGMLSGILNGFVVVVCVVAAVGVLFALPTAILIIIYVYPYAIWMASQNDRGKHLNQKNAGVWKLIKNATKLYKAWILHREPTF